jgi:hypothetical protein
MAGEKKFVHLGYLRNEQETVCRFPKKGGRKKITSKQRPIIVKNQSSFAS